MPEDEDRILGLQLVTAAATGALEMLKLTLSAGTDVHFDDDLALRSAAFTGNFETLAYLVERGANVQAAGNEALFYAAKRSETEMVQLLLSKGANVDDMMKHHKQELDENVLAVLDKHRSTKLSEAFEQSLSRLKKAPDTLRLPPRNKPPKP